jgi:hypothetical protein
MKYIYVEIDNKGNLRPHGPKLKKISWADIEWSLKNLGIKRPVVFNTIQSLKRMTLKSQTILVEENIFNTYLVPKWDKEKSYSDKLKCHIKK